MPLPQADTPPPSSCPGLPTAELEQLLAAQTLGPTLPPAPPTLPVIPQLLNNPPVSHGHATQARHAAPPTFGAAITTALEASDPPDLETKEELGVLDLRLATPLMRASLQKSLCDG